MQGEVDDVVQAAPKWLLDLRNPAQWEPLAVGEEVESQSAVCIRKLQVPDGRAVMGGAHGTRCGKS